MPSTLLTSALALALAAPAAPAGARASAAPATPPTSTPAATPRPPKVRAADLAALDRVAREELAATKTPGAAIAVILGGRLVHLSAFGVTSVETRAPVTPATLFRLGSTTKMLTGAALVALADSGRLELDAPIERHIAKLPPRLGRVTVHQLLSNSGGVADFAAPFVSHDDDALGRMVAGWTDDVLFGEPGRVYSYASPGFWLAGHVLERAGGKPYADMMRDLVFAPAGMTRTTLRPLDALTHPLALGHEQKPGGPAIIRPAFDNVAMWPAGSVYSSAEELARLVTILLAGGRSGDRQVLPATLLGKLSGEYVAMPGDPAVRYGYGLLVFEHRGVRMVMHGGFSRGYGSMIQIAPAHGFAVIVVTNSSGQTLPRTTEKAQALFLPRTAEVTPPKPPLALTRDDHRRLAGTYVNGAQRWELRSVGDRLVLVDGATEVPLTKTGEWRLSFGDTLENDLALVPGADGRAEYLFTGLYTGRRR